MNLIDVNNIDCTKLPKKLYPYMKDILDFFDVQPTIDVIPKNEYETRLKADMSSMLYKLRSEIINIPKYFPYADHTRMFIDGDVVVGLIDNKIDALRENEDGKID